MFDFHTDKSRYFDFQYRTSKEYILPFIEKFIDLNKPLKVLEIGCAEAGVLKAFTERGHICTGIELSPSRVELAKSFMKQELEEGKISFITEDIYKINPEKDLPHKFDLIILKDVIEHIPGQEVFMNELKKFLAPGGKVFFAFPPWYMPFGGHQQLCKSKVAGMLPYYHILPGPLYRLILRMFGEDHNKIEALMEIKDTGISIERFERIVKRNDCKILRRKLFLINPIYKYKFNIKVREQLPLISSLYFLRNFFTTCAYFLIEKKI